MVAKDQLIRDMDEGQKAAFWSLVEKLADNGCWLWRGSSRSKENRLNPEPYGVFILAPHETRYAHRIAYIASGLPLEEWQVLDHLCRVHLCVKPSHLEQVTDGINLRRGEGFVGLNSRKTECKSGHSLEDPANVWIEVTKAGGAKRRCVACSSERLGRARQRSHSAERVAKPSRAQLEAVADKPALALAREYGVSDVTIRKWLDAYGIARKRIGRRKQ